MRISTIILTCIVLVFTRPLPAQENAEPIFTGEKHVIFSRSLDQDREIFVRVPAGYDTSRIDYPVHVILDGEVTFFCYAGLVEILSGEGRSGAPIVVGIPNVNRGDDLNPKKHGYSFLDFIGKELLPYIDHHYRTSGQRLFCGYSMGGTYVIFALLNAPDYFSSYLAGSPYRMDIFSDVEIGELSEKIRDTTTLYTSMGQNDLAKQMEYY
jgi:predicted alpha/beta superfamily hydrolase